MASNVQEALKFFDMMYDFTGSSLIKISLYDRLIGSLMQLDSIAVMSSVFFTISMFALTMIVFETMGASRKMTIVSALLISLVHFVALILIFSLSS